MTLINFQVFDKWFWLEFKELNFNNGLNGTFLGKIKNVNFETRNIEKFKEEETSRNTRCHWLSNKIRTY